MKYTTEIYVELPLNEFIKKFNDPHNLKHWQRGLVSYDHISGIPGEVGSKMILIYDFGRRKMELTETIIENNLPHSMYSSYDTNGMSNIQKNYFESTGANQTKWVSKNEFIPTGFALRLMTLIMPGAFKKQTKKYMLDFKNFAEKNISVSNEKN
ncbi:SRPBCC family protein [Mangrovimonas sp. AS39]|uniref:SRPBCC family protein n=1 Tax=Mangrovimonas TaxID=1211036 RepID=UPI0006B4DAC6|nr:MULTISPECIES: SRPBCC family protein [Mangrovimonas]MCF1191916.1 SRPBCC family protein [Mangrovimonas futianensis]MCF1195611.1 SRPBCC family protein [Mangrovimonas futianensis]NIK92929.1 SRPBCC family protein [Mangrovimonas sp. CR14]